MGQYALYAAPSGPGFVVDVQADLLKALSTRVVVPLLPVDAAPPPARHLNPVFEVDGVRHVMVTQYMSAVRRAVLDPSVGSLAERSDEITRAMDMLTHGL